MRLVIFILYNIFIYPLFFLITIFLSLFNKKIRDGFIGRFRTKSALMDYFNNNNSNSLIYWLHCSSYGEYLQVEPVIDGIKKDNINSIILLSFFSPSGYDNTHNQNVDCKIYMPFDFYWTIHRDLGLVNPHKIIIATTDFWYNFIWIAKLKKIDTILIGAKSKKYFDKNLSLLHYFYKPVYQSISKIFTITQNDTTSMGRYIGVFHEQKVHQMGNPRFDQTISNTKQILDIDKKPILERQNILLFGSMHHEDRNIVLAHVIKYLEENHDLEIIWVSHEPSEQDTKYLVSMFNQRNISVGIIDSIEKVDISKDRVKIINAVGILSKLYWTVKMAYIGGGFSTGVHNLMEPSVAEVPTIFGPNYNDFDEAIKILNNRSGFCIKNGKELIRILDLLLGDDQKLLLASTSAKDLINNNSGASNRIVEAILMD